MSPSVASPTRPTPAGGAGPAPATAAPAPPPPSSAPLHPPARSHHRHDDAPAPSGGRASSSTSPVRGGDGGGRPVNAVRALLSAAKAALHAGRTPSDAELAGLVRLAGAIPLSQLGLDDPAAAGRQASPPACRPAHSSEGSEGTTEAAAGAAAPADPAGLARRARRLSLSDPPPPVSSTAEDDGSSEDAMDDDGGDRPAKRASPPRPAAVDGGGAGGAAPPGDRPPPPRPPITYLHIAEDADVSLGVFCLPPGAVIPLHNHPGMTVVSRVLYGSLAVRSFDWVDGDDDADEPAAPRPATLVTDAVLTPSAPPSVLRPSAGGNIHAFASVGSGPTAVLDLLAPPYSGGEGGRDCTYFAEEEGEGGRGGGCAAWPSPDPARPSSPGAAVRLAPIPAPDWFKVEHGNYRGVRADAPPTTAAAPGREKRRARA